MFVRILLIVGAAIGLALHPTPSLAQEDGVAQLEEIVVIARRSGAPMWEVRGGGSTLIVIGEISELPSATRWDPSNLEAATRRADRVILPIETRISGTDVLRLFWRVGRVAQLPPGRTVADYLEPEDLERLREAEQRYRRSYSTQSPLMSANDLLNNRLGFNRDTQVGPSGVVRREARRLRLPTRPVGVMRGDDIVESLLAAPPESHTPCLAAALLAAQYGPEGIAERGGAWARQNVIRVMASPLEEAAGRCWPWSDATIGSDLRSVWTSALEEALAQPGVTLAIAPLRVLAEFDGVLDRMAARNELEIVGPEWRDEDSEQP